MGLDVVAKGLERTKSYHCGYVTFMVFRKELAKTYDQTLGQLYEDWINGLDLTDEEFDAINNGFLQGLLCFLSHPDCDGKFSWQECREIYKVIKDMKMDLEGHNYIEMNNYNMLEQWKGMFLHCWKRRVNMYFY